jgi:hypothetical protein
MAGSHHKGDAILAWNCTPGSSQRVRINVENGYESGSCYSQDSECDGLKGHERRADLVARKLEVLQQAWGDSSGRGVGAHPARCIETERLPMRGYVSMGCRTAFSIRPQLRGYADTWPGARSGVSTSDCEVAIASQSESSISVLRCGSG